MNAERDIYTGKTMAQLEREWQRNEHDLLNLHFRRERLKAELENLSISGYELDLSNWHDLQEAINALQEKQMYIEGWLIEHEAPGWTST